MDLRQKSDRPAADAVPLQGGPRHEAARQREGCGYGAVGQRQRAVGLFVFKIASGGGLTAIVFVFVSLSEGLGQGPVAIVGVGVGDLLSFGAAEDGH